MVLLLSVVNAATNGGIAFSDGSNGGADAYRGMISYQHNDNHMQFRTNAVERMRISIVLGMLE